VDEKKMSHIMTQEEFERALADNDGDMVFILSLYVTGATPKSARAIANIKAICETYLKDRYELEIIDIYQQPELARKGEIVAAPTLIKQLPLPLRKLVGDMSNEDNVLAGLGLRPKVEKRQDEIDNSGKSDGDKPGHQERNGSAPNET